MSSVELLLTLSLWYLPGALAARSMIRRGYAPEPWIFAAWIGGALCLVGALVVTATIPPPADDDPVPEPLPSPPPDRMHR